MQRTVTVATGLSSYDTLGDVASVFNVYTKLEIMHRARRVAVAIAVAMIIMITAENHKILSQHFHKAFRYRFKLMHARFTCISA
jgi:hypothetical protein